MSRSSAPLGDGISVVQDSAGRILAEQSTDDGPVMLVADVPVAAPAG